MERNYFVLERIYRITHIPIRYLDAGGRVTLLNFGYEPLADPIACDAKLSKSIRSKNRPGLPRLESQEEVLYGQCMDSMGNHIILGPISTSRLEQVQMNRYAASHGVEDSSFKIKRRTLSELCAALALLYYVSTGKFCTEYEIATSLGTSDERGAQKAVEYQTYELEYAEEGISRHNFSVEKDFTSDIRNGDPDAAIRRAASRLTTFKEEQVGKLANKSLKQNEYMGCTAIVLASRAAIEGGLDSLTSYLMSDLYMQRLEKCTQTAEIYQLIQEMTIEYASQVKSHREERSRISYVEQCKNYIAKHLSTKFAVDDIAEEIGISADHLSRQFTKTERLGIRQYTQKKRIEAACNMLRFSDESLLSISNYLCFNSQSHFGKVFREHTGLTPQKYRNENKINDFKTL